MTFSILNANILEHQASATVEYMERYRSGHNEAVLKTVCPQGRVGSNPTLSAGENDENQLTKMSKKLEKVFDKQK